MAHKNHSMLKSSLDLNSLTNEQRQSIDPALKAYPWTPIPIGMVVTAYLAELMSFLSGKSTQEILQDCHILDGTAGAGGSTIALAHSFHHVTAGDFC
jgi:uncharacterized membrane protein